MAGWLINKCSVPLRWGMTTINNLTANTNIFAANLISFIFNEYGSRILKMEISDIIERTECTNDVNYFHIRPLKLRQLEQQVSASILMIDDGTIENLVVAFPWRNFGSKPAVITVAKISFSMNILKQENDLSHSLDISNSYLRGLNISTRENQNLLDIYHEIVDLIMEKFKHIHFKVQTVNITVKSATNFSIIINNLSYINDVLTVDNVTFSHPEMGNLARLNDILYHNNESNMISIKTAIVRYELSRCIPDIYLSNDSSTTNQITINISELSLDSLNVANLQLVSKPDNIQITVASVVVSDIVTCTWINSNVLNVVYDLRSNVYLFNNPLSIHIYNFPSFTSWITSLTKFVSSLQAKIHTLPVESNEPITSVPPQIHGLLLHVVNTYESFDMEIGHLILTDIVKMANVKFTAFNTFLCAKNFFIKDNLFIATNFTIKNSGFNVKANMAQLQYWETKIQIGFDDAETDNVQAIVHFIMDIIQKFKAASESHERSVEESRGIFDHNGAISPEEPDRKIFLLLINSRLNFILHNENFQLVVESGELDISGHQIMHLTSSLNIDQFLIMRLKTGVLSVNDLDIEHLCMYVDPHIIHRLRRLLATLMPTTGNASIDSDRTSTSDSPQTMLNSFLADSLAELQDYVQEHNFVNSSGNSKDGLIFDIDTEAPQLNLISGESLYLPGVKFFGSDQDDLTKIFIDDYENLHDDSFELKIKIVSFHLYLFDELKSRQMQTPTQSAFMRVVLKDILITKKSHEIIEPSAIPVCIIQHNRGERCSSFDKYSLRISTGAVIDMKTTHNRWKYFVKLSPTDALSLNVHMIGDFTRISIHLSPINVNVREELLTKMTTFFALNQPKSRITSHHMVEHFHISGLYVTLNYSPSIFPNIGFPEGVFAIYDHQFILSPQTLRYVDGFNTLAANVIAKWKSELNPDNIVQFIPNMRVIKPMALPVIKWLNAISRYL